jgi:hypothetical protein
MKNLPIGIQTLPEFIDFNFIYVDKTEFVYKLVTTGKYYFFSRPRRFGKSLLISTLKELFLGNKHLFSKGVLSENGLWIADKWDWSKPSPVIHFSFDKMSYNQLGLEKAISDALQDWAKHYDIQFETNNFKSQFEELLKKVSAKHGDVVLLIDEYDKPIIDFKKSSDCA